MNPEEIGSFLEPYTYENLLEEALDRVPEGIDIREGSIIYDALAPACYQLADFNMQLKNMLLDSFTLTAQGTYLDLKAQEHGITRYNSTHAIRKGNFLTSDGGPFEHLESGDRFSSVGQEGIYFVVIRSLDIPGEYELEAEEPGTLGNSYFGQLLPVTSINSLGQSEISDVLVPARNVESDENLRERLFTHLKTTSFAGNWQSYIDIALDISGVGQVQVYPIWNGGGTVKISVIDSDFNIPSDPFASSIKEEIDPEENSGLGYGIAPIGHQVTVDKPAKRIINISMTIDVLINHTIESLRSSIIEAIENYFLELRKTWGNANALHEYSQTVYRSQIIAAIMQVEGVANVANLRLNNAEIDIKLTMSGQAQEIAFLGEVNL